MAVVPRGPDQEEKLLIKTSVVDERRIRRILEEAESRYENEFMDDAERLLLLERIKRLRRKLTM